MSTLELRDEFHKLIDRIDDEDQLRTFFELLSTQVEPRDERPSPELEARLEEALHSFESGDYITHEEMKRRAEAWLTR
jgi:hypothetical protein